MLSSLVLSAALSIQTAPPPPAPGPEPEPYPRIRLTDYLPPLEAADRGLEEARAFLNRNGQDDLPWTRPQVEMTAGEDLSRTALSVAFNWVWLGEGDGRRPVWFARLRAMSWNGAIERFADSRTCPGVEESLRRLDALSPVDPFVPAPPVPGPSDVVVDTEFAYMHDNSYGIRLRGQSDGRAFTDRLQLNGGSGSAFAPVIADSLTRLKPCWTNTPPPRR